MSVAFTSLKKTILSKLQLKEMFTIDKIAPQGKIFQNYQSTSYQTQEREKFFRQGEQRPWEPKIDSTHILTQKNL